MGKLSREKGKSGEREARDVLIAWGLPARRGKQFKGTEDSPDVATVPSLYVEVKRRQKFSLPEALKQAAQEAPGGAIPVVLHRRDREPWILSMHAKDAPAFAEQLLAAIVGPEREVIVAIDDALQRGGVIGQSAPPLPPKPGRR